MERMPDTAHLQEFVGGGGQYSPCPPFSKTPLNHASESKLIFQLLE